MARFIVGIDLGTTNTVVAFAEPGKGSKTTIELFEVEQLVAPGEVARRPMLPSMEYHPAPGELNHDDIRLPWLPGYSGNVENPVVGALAQALGSQVPGRLVASAKSWLSHPTADRSAPILPWGGDDSLPRISPLSASANYLAHLRASWNQTYPKDRLEDQDVVLTVPASFDEAARGLTLDAARMAGIRQLQLVEEPQAAFHDWMFRSRDHLGEQLGDTRLVLVCDVGGGTTDLTLIKVQFQDETPVFTRIGVGDHLMLGGDNMDLGLAHLAEGTFSSPGNPLSSARLSQLIQQCRQAKERLLATDAPEKVSVTLLGGGSRLIGGTRSMDLERQAVDELVVDGFFPSVSREDHPRRSRAGIVEFGLPYASDPGITRHLARFLDRHQGVCRDAMNEAGEGSTGPVIPDTLLLNGGVFNAQSLRDRLAGVLEQWRGGPIKVLVNEHPDTAVARGAVSFRLARLGRAPRIGGGSARSYLLVMDDDNYRTGICLLPKGTDEGRKVALDDRVFALRVGQPVRFHLVSSTIDEAYKPGQVVDISCDSFLHLPPFATVIGTEKATGAREVPVQLVTELTEIGTLELHCIETDNPDQKWKLEFQTRKASQAGGDAQVALADLPPNLPQALEAIGLMYGERSQRVGPKEIKLLNRKLEKLIGSRESWTTPLLRELFGQLWEDKRRRRRSQDHERVWLNLAGFCLRPGFGHPLDDWRVQQLWSAFSEGIQYTAAGQNWSEWWTLWRRVAGGLDERQQLLLLDGIAFSLQPPGKGARKRPKGPKMQGYDDMVRLAATLERVPVERKIEVGHWLLQRLSKSGENPHSWWAVGRIGARVPVHGSSHTVVPADEATKWLEALLQLNWRKVEQAPFAAVMLSRMSGDRDRDLDLAVRERVISKLKTVKGSERWVSLVREVVELDKADERRVVGDSLPVGLKLMD
ncbi:MAG: hsp70 family protein [Gammaproteobacteria bacterium]|nr:hsp70 family protein [Gammaproteobacteria bacterium]